MISMILEYHICSNKCHSVEFISLAILVQHLFKNGVYNYGATSCNFILYGGLEVLQMMLAKSSQWIQPAISKTKSPGLAEDEEELEDNETVLDDY